METELTKLPILKYLNKCNPMYYGKILELHKYISSWLELIPDTFPHYTRHTIYHSDQIIIQLSSLLFNEKGITKISFSGMEIYILLASAILHDAGMVTTQNEKVDLLSSNEWKEWISNGSGKSRWSTLNSLDKMQLKLEPNQLEFIKATQIRYLIAEFIRRQHHKRTKNLLILNEQYFTNFNLNDQSLLLTIGDVCCAHGLNTQDFEDKERYPDQRDLLGEKVNVKFLAILLRLGDLLDMSTDRACPLLLNQACPIPSDSLAHWKQYSRITHRLTSPEKIEISANCDNQEEHRILQDWCQWIYNEIKEASILMNRSSRHSLWKAPKVEISGKNPTIKISPSKSACYIPSNWNFKLDTDKVLQRLIVDTYENPQVFIRELIQNALDASRCKIYLELEERNIPLPPYPDEIQKDILDKYPIKISIREEEIFNKIINCNENRQIISIEDFGIGMDEDIITNYFLQVGRSYYESEDFRRTYKFVPSSKFGIGFLSVFGVSERIVVETKKYSIIDNYQPIKIELTGPRNYLLTTRGERENSGTKIEVVLTNKFDKGKLEHIVKEWCKRVEFPIIIKDFDNEIIIESENSESICKEFNSNYKSFPIELKAAELKLEGIKGEIYFTIWKDDDIEYWSKFESGMVWDPLNKMRELTLPSNLLCAHGIKIDESASYSYRLEAISVRQNVKKMEKSLPLSRIGNNLRYYLNSDEIVNETQRIIKEHFEISPICKKENSWKYKQQVIDRFSRRFNTSFMPDLKRSIRYFLNGESVLTSLNELIILPQISFMLFPRNKGNINFRDIIPNFIKSIPSMIMEDISYLSTNHLEKICADRDIIEIKALECGRTAFILGKSKENDKFGMGTNVDFFNLDDPRPLGYYLLLSNDSRSEEINKIILNESNNCIKWFKDFITHCQIEQSIIDNEDINKFKNIIIRVLTDSSSEHKKLIFFLEKLNKDLTNYSKPPTIDEWESSIYYMVQYR